MQSGMYSLIIGEFVFGAIRGIALSVVWVAIVWIIASILAKMNLQYRRRKVYRRIKKQMKAAGTWNAPQALGGRALEILAWERCGLRRQPGETDKNLRNRCVDVITAKTIMQGGADDGKS